jgi:hypothetical protein
MRLRCVIGRIVISYCAKSTNEKALYSVLSLFGTIDNTEYELTTFGFV